MTEPFVPESAYGETQIIPAVKDVWNMQVGGNHYKEFAIQPTEYIIKNGLNFCEGNIVKYVTRYRKKNGLEDLYKARHYLDILIDSLEKDVNGR